MCYFNFQMACFENGKWLEIILNFDQFLFFSANISKYKILFVNLLRSFTAKNIAVTLKFACLVLLLDVNYLICLDEKLWRLLVLNVKAFSLKTYSLKAFLSFCFFFPPQILQRIPLSDLSTLSHAKTRILHTVSTRGNAL